MAVDFQKVPRPTTLRAFPAVLDAIIETATDGEAIKVTMPKENLINWQANVRHALRQAGYKLSYRHNDLESTLTVWAEKLDK